MSGTNLYSKRLREYDREPVTLTGSLLSYIVMNDNICYNFFGFQSWGRSGGRKGIRGEKNPAYLYNCHSVYFSGYGMLCDSDAI